MNNKLTEEEIKEWQEVCGDACDPLCDLCKKEIAFISLKKAEWQKEANELVEAISLYNTDGMKALEQARRETAEKIIGEIDDAITMFVGEECKPVTLKSYLKKKYL